jgi:hypothetical protein
MHVNVANQPASRQENATSAMDFAAMTGAGSFGALA